jgi:hypothetical protein
MKRDVLLPLILLLLALMAGTVSAQPKGFEIRADMTFTSRHYVDGNFNEFNPGGFVSVYKRTSYGALGVGVGAYYNSFATTATAAAGRLRLRASKWVVFGLDVGVVTGYSRLVDGPEGPAGMKPLMVPSIRIGPPEMRLAIMNIGRAVGVSVTFTP